MRMHKEFKNNIKIIILIVITFFILYILHVSIGSYFGVESEGTYDDINPTIIFETDTTNKTLTVVEKYPMEVDFYWPEISVASGSATLPYNTVDIGDEITDCEGNLKLVYDRTGATIYEGVFN
jgi:hypothetical protein